MPHVIIRVSAEQKEKLRQACEAKGMTVAGAIRLGLKAIGLTVLPNNKNN